MISVIMPYWNRRLALARSVATMARHYPDLDMEIVVVNDGSAETPVLDNCPWPVKIVHLPRKDIPLNPCVPINRGVEASSGDIIVLTNPEVVHVKPILAEMRAAMDGPDSYVLAAAWCPDEGKWHCHSSIAGDRPSGERQPEGSGFHFCAMLTRDLWNRAGGFDEAYRDGAGYDDPDWVNRVARAGARFTIRDDLVVIHPKMGAKTDWLPGQFARNRTLYFRRWPLPLTVAMVNAGDYLGRGAEYVSRLVEGVESHLTIPHRFRIFESTEASWWAKLEMFRPDAFPAGERVLYLDLDSIVTGSLDDIATYAGPFACLRDFYRPWGLGSGVMLWEHGTCNDLWSEWDAKGRPKLKGGDQAWVEVMRPDAVRLQDQFPGQFASWKRDCVTGIPAGTRVVCFHGKPRPHEVGWAKQKEAAA